MKRRTSASTVNYIRDQNRQNFSRERLGLRAYGNGVSYYKTSQFRFDADEQRFTATASSLRIPKGYAPTVIQLRSEKTDIVKIFIQLPDQTEESELIKYKCKDMDLWLDIEND